MAIESRNPATGEVVKTFKPLNAHELEARLTKSAKAFVQYRQTDLKDRAALLDRAADILDRDCPDLARIATLEMGKTYKAAQAEIEKCALVCRYYAQNGPNLLADHHVQTKAKQAYTTLLPLGPILAIMPWNFPFWQVFRFAAPALMAGNCCLLKHASNVPQCALKIEAVFRESGLMEGVFQTLLIGSDKVEAILRDPRVRGASLTGSEPAGSNVSAICGSEIKPSVLELGGSDPFIIMPSADIDKAVSMAVTARTMNNGQSCIAAKRFIVHEAIYDTVRARLIAAFEALIVGDPMHEDTDVGPLVSADGLKDVTDMVEQAVQQGARRVTGAKPIKGQGYFYQPGILEDIKPDMPLYKAEIFGPVAQLYKVSDLDAAIKLANITEFGLGSAIFTHDVIEQERAIREIEAGATFVNAMTRSDPRLPFGGIKKSGFGREMAREGLLAFSNIKTVLVQ